MTDLEALKEGRLAALSMSMNAQSLGKKAHWDDAAEVLTAQIASKEAGLVFAGQVQNAVQDGHAMTETVALQLVLDNCPNDPPSNWDDFNYGMALMVARSKVSDLIGTVLHADETPAVLIEMAEAVLVRAGRVVTFWVDTGWIVSYMADHHMEPTDAELQNVIMMLQTSEDVGTTEAAMGVLDEWMQAHWQV